MLVVNVASHWRLDPLASRLGPVHLCRSTSSSDNGVQQRGTSSCVLRHVFVVYKTRCALNCMIVICPFDLCVLYEYDAHMHKRFLCFDGNGKPVVADRDGYMVVNMDASRAYVFASNCDTLFAGVTDLNGNFVDSTCYAIDRMTEICTPRGVDLVHSLKDGNFKSNRTAMYYLNRNKIQRHAYDSKLSQGIGDGTIYHGLSVDIADTRIAGIQWGVTTGRAVIIDIGTERIAKQINTSGVANLGWPNQLWYTPSYNQRMAQMYDMRLNEPVIKLSIDDVLPDDTRELAQFNGVDSGVVSYIAEITIGYKHGKSYNRTFALFDMRNAIAYVENDVPILAHMSAWL